MRTCIVIPTFNESKNIADIVTQLMAKNLEVLVVDDGSRDGTADIARKSGAAVIENKRNTGKGASLIRGFEYCLKNNFDAVLTMDGDGQHSPDEAERFIEETERQDAQVFIGNRMHRAKDMPLSRWLTNIFMSWVISLIARQKISDSQCGFRLIKREVLENTKLRSVKYEIESEILIRASRNGYKIFPVNIQSIYRGEKSQINPFIDTLRFIWFIFGELWTLKP